MTPILRTLKHLTYITQCLADDIRGEAKSDIDYLVDLLERDPKFAFTGSAQAASDLRLVVAEIREGGEKFRDGKWKLFRLSDRPWNEVLPELPS